MICMLYASCLYVVWFVCHIYCWFGLLAGVPDDTNVEDAKALEVEGVHAAEQGDIDRAVGCFTQAIRLAPHWPSSYNNRAQALRLIGDIAGTVVLYYMSELYRRCITRVL